MKRIIVHWTAGQHKASALDREHYHFLVEGDGTVIEGTFPVAANESTVDGHYAAHTKGCNAGSIGVSMCCMVGARQQPFVAGPAPMTLPQWNAMVGLVARLAVQYRIPVRPDTILSHAEVQGTLGIAQRGKWDISRLAFDAGVVGAKACGDKLRAEVAKAIAARRPMYLVEPDTEGEASPAKAKGPAPRKPDGAKPVLKHRRVWAALTGWLGGGGAASLGMFAGWDWMALIVICGFVTLWALIFIWLYRAEIREGLFSGAPRE